MGFFDRLAGKKTSPQTAPVAAKPTPAPIPTSVEPAAASPVAGSILPRLAAARACLEVKDLPGALAIYEEVLAAAGERADVLVTISGDLGSTGYVANIVELIAPRYDAQIHGPATGLNSSRPDLALRQADAAQHVLDILFELNRPELEDRLHGFSNAIAELIVSGAPPLPLHGATPDPDDGSTQAPPAAAKVDIVSISKPIWFYGLESLAEKILPPKSNRVRRVAFAQLALPGAYTDVLAAQARPEDELGRLARAIPLWFAETFDFSPHYSPIAAVGVFQPAGGGAKQPVIFGAEWTTENLRQLCDSPNGEGLDYIFTGALRSAGRRLRAPSARLGGEEIPRSANSSSSAGIPLAPMSNSPNSTSNSASSWSGRPRKPACPTPHPPRRGSGSMRSAPRSASSSPRRRSCPKKFSRRSRPRSTSSPRTR